MSHLLQRSISYGQGRQADPELFFPIATVKGPATRQAGTA